MSKLRIEGEVAAPCALGFEELASLAEQVPDLSRAIPGRQGGGVRLAAILAVARPTAAATHATLESADGRFRASVALADVASAIVAYRYGDAPLPAAQGGPIRFFLPDVDGCATDAVSRCSNVKDLAAIRLTAGPGDDSRPRDEREHAALHARESAKPQAREGAK
jgi:DMSO/TMAO reductase YedYZ molybdopterin-dependent catalytic subunit